MTFWQVVLVGLFWVAPIIMS